MLGHIFFPIFIMNNEFWRGDSLRGVRVRLAGLLVAGVLGEEIYGRNTEEVTQ